MKNALNFDWTVEKKYELKHRRYNYYDYDCRSNGIMDRIAELTKTEFVV